MRDHERERSREEVGDDWIRFVQAHAAEPEGTMPEVVAYRSFRLANIHAGFMALSLTRIAFTISNPGSAGILYYGVTCYKGEGEQEESVYSLSYAREEQEFTHGVGQDDFRQPAEPGEVDQTISVIYLAERDGSMTPIN
jgi:hypothetical protein